MASLKEIKGRIASVSSTLKITSAMKMVASAKLHKAQAAIGNMLPYEQRLSRILAHLLAQRISYICHLLSSLALHNRLEQSYCIALGESFYSYKLFPTTRIAGGLL